MYYIYAIVDGVKYPIHNPKAQVLITGDPYYQVGDNVNGQAEFTIYPDHPYYSKVKKLTTDIEIYKDDAEEPEFAGRVLYDDETINGTKKVFVEGELAYLCDSIQRPKVYHDTTVKAYFTALIKNHNSQVEERKQFQVGRVTVTDSNDSLYRYSNWETTRECISDKLIDRLGGHIVIRHEDGLRYIDYLCDDDFYENAEQTISFGENLLDFAKNIDASDIATCIIPLGATLDEDEQDESLEAIGDDQRLTISDVNGGVDYVTDDNAVATYGKIFKTVIWDDVTEASNLKKKAAEYLKGVQYENMTLEVKAIDLSLAYDDYDSFHIGSKVRCISTPNALDAWFPVSEMTVYITQFSKNSLTLGNKSTHSTYTSSNKQTTAEIEQSVTALPSKSEILRQSLKDAQSLINSRIASGYAIHEPNEFIVADDLKYKTAAQNLWRWGLGGLAHYSEGYYGAIDGIALTMDGKINGKMLMVGSVYAESIDIGYRTEVESAIEDSEDAAEKYADGKVTAAKQTIQTAISNFEDRINLSVSSAKETVMRKNYVTGGEQETLNIDGFTISGDYATVEEAEFLNMKCLRLTFTATGAVYINQDVGTLAAGEYTVSVESAFPSGTTAAEYRPIYIAFGFSNSRDTEYFDTYTADEFYSFKKTVSISKSSKAVSIGVYGSAGQICYLTNIRCLRDIQGIIDDLNAKLTLDIGQVQASVSDIYEMSTYSKAMLTVLQNAISAEVTRASGKEETLQASITLNTDNITSCVTKDNVGSYITQYYDNVIFAFNSNSNYVQIGAGNISIYDDGVESSKKRAEFDQNGIHFYRDGYYVGKVGTNFWTSDNSHKGLVFDLEENGKYMCWAYRKSSESNYTTVLCFARENSIYGNFGLHCGCNLYGNWFTLQNFKIGSISAGGYTGYTGAIPIVTDLTISATSNGGISWSYYISKIRVYNGIVIGYWN